MILIVDSENISDIKIKGYFEEWGFSSVCISKTASQAREFLSVESNREKITSIIIDSSLEDADGFEFCREIIKNKWKDDRYIIILVSSEDNKTAIEKARHSGANSIAVKPYNSKLFQKYFFKFVNSKAVLLVDDDPLIRKIVSGILSKNRLEVLEVDDGIKASNLLNVMIPPKFIVMDIGLPNMNGIQLVEKVRSKPAWGKIPIIMLTGSSDIKDVKKSLAAGANDYLTKPIDIVEFNKRINRYLS